MTRYRYYTATSLDGFLADEHGSLDWLLSQPLEEHSILPYDDFVAEIGAVVMGATTYEWVLEHTPAEQPWEYAQPSFVFTHRDLERAAEHITLLSGPPADHRARIEEAADGKDVWVLGGGDLVAQCAAAGMLDEVFLTIAPVLLGAGAPLFTSSYDLELRDQGRRGVFLEALYDVVGPRTGGELR